MDWMNTPLFISLVSGFIGTIIGGAITLIVTVYSIRESSKKNLDLEITKQKWDKEAQITNSLNALLVESRVNLESIKKWKNHRRKFRFNIDAWSVAKPLVLSFSKELQEKLLNLYAEIFRHNTLIDYDLRVPFGSGAKDSEIERQMGDVEVALTDLLSVLEKDKHIKRK